MKHPASAAFYPRSTRKKSARQAAREMALARHAFDLARPLALQVFLCSNPVATAVLGQIERCICPLNYGFHRVRGLQQRCTD